MPLYRANILINSRDLSPAVGWSESWEFESPTDQFATGIFDVIRKGRPLFLALNYDIVGFRLSKLSFATVAGKCKKFQSLVAPFTCVPAIQGQLGDADTMWAAVYVRIPLFPPDLPVLGANRFRAYEVRGGPDTWWQGGALSIPGPDKANILTYIQQLQAAYLVGHAKPIVGCEGGSIVRYNCNQACFQRISNRKVGRPFGGVRGRRSVTTPTP